MNTLYIREYASGNVRKNWNQGYCVQTASKWLQLCVCFDWLNLADKPDVYSLLLQVL